MESSANARAYRDRNESLKIISVVEFDRSFERTSRSFFPCYVANGCLIRFEFPCVVRGEISAAICSEINRRWLFNMCVICDARMKIVKFVTQRGIVLSAGNGFEKRWVAMDRGRSWATIKSNRLHSEFLSHLFFHNSMGCEAGYRMCIRTITTKSLGLR